jgi:predicted RNase H-like HicB family nuclease
MGCHTFSIGVAFISTYAPLAGITKLIITYVIKLTIRSNKDVIIGGEKERRSLMISTYTAKYSKTESGYMGQLVEWPEVVTEGKTIEECRTMLQDALKEMILAYKQQKKEIPKGGALLEQIPAEI